MSIRKACKSDAKVLYIIEEHIFGVDNFGLSLASFYYHIGHNLLYVIEQDGEVVGYILWLRRKLYYRLYSLCIDKAYQGRGFAQNLLDYSFEHLQELSFSLEVHSDNQKAIELYKKNGFIIKKRLVGYYPQNVDGYKMVKSLKAIC